MNKIPCYYAIGGINYKNGFVTSCPQGSDQLHVIEQIIRPSEIINNEKFKQHRKDLMSGVWPEGCHLCKEVEEAKAGKSMREDYPADERYYDPSGTVDFKSLRHIELRFSNSCNMACLHCSDVYSSGWSSKLRFYVPNQEDHKYRLMQLTREMHRRSPDENLSMGLSVDQVLEIVDDLNNNFPNIEKIDFAGGEVLYQKQFFPCLERLAEHPNAKNINLTFHSNFNAKFDPVRLSELLAAFGKSLIHISVDAGTNIYSYFRTGSWDTLVSNIEKFRSVNNFTKLDAVCTTSIYQIMDIENVFESILSLDVNSISSSIVFTPRYINPSLMMLEFKEYVLSDIRDTYKMIDKNHRPKVRADSAKRALKKIEDYMLNYDSLTHETYEAFSVYVKKTDVLWKQNFNQHMVKYKYIDNKIVRV
jgi:hypothetical protein